MEYKVLEGDKYTFETKLNELISQGWTVFSNLQVFQGSECIMYSIVLSKIKDIK